MKLRLDDMFLEFDTAVQHCVANTFLLIGNVQAYKVHRGSYTKGHVIYIYETYETSVWWVS